MIAKPIKWALHELLSRCLAVHLDENKAYGWDNCPYRLVVLRKRTDYFCPLLAASAKRWLASGWGHGGLSRSSRSVCRPMALTTPLEVEASQKGNNVRQGSVTVRYPLPRPWGLVFWLRGARKISHMSDLLTTVTLDLLVEALPQPLCERQVDIYKSKPFWVGITLP